MEATRTTILRLTLLPLLASLIALTACEDAPSAPKDDADSETSTETKQQAVAEKPEEEEPPPPPRRDVLEPWRSLLDEVPRAELRAGGLLIDLGTADSFKYTRGGWQNRWTDLVTTDEGVTATKLDGAEAPLDLHVREGDAVAEVVVRVRGRCEGQTLEVALDDRVVGEVEAPEEWTTARVAAGGLKPGNHTLWLRPKKRCKGFARAQVDWVWLADESGAAPPKLDSRRDPIKVGGAPRRALTARTPRTYSFFLHVPEDEGAELVFDFGAEGGQPEFIVSVTTDGQATEEVFREEAGASWKEGAVALAKWAGQGVRLDLTTTAPADEAGWAEVEVMVPELEEGPEVDAPGDVPKNLVYIVIDTVRADVFEPFGGEGSPVQTPTFDALTKDATVFSQAYANENWTKPSVATILSGLYPVTHDTNGEEETVPEAVEMLAERLQRKDFNTGAFIANGYVSRDFGFNQGWDYYTNFIRERKNTTAKAVYREAVQWLKKNHDERFFLYVQAIDPHVPYRVASKYTDLYYEGDYRGIVPKALGGLRQEELSGSDRLDEDDYKWIKALYHGEVTYHDEHMASLIEALRELGELDDTLLVISHDHGEEINDHGKMGHRHTLYDELLRGPLLMRHPGRLPQGHVVDELVEYVDLAPTILDLLQLEPSPAHEGLSLVPLIEGRRTPQPRYVVSEFLDDRRALRVGRWKLIRSDEKIEALFDMKEDPGEQKNLAGKAPIASRLCHVYLGEALANPNKRQRLLNTITGKKFKSGEIAIEGELRKQLEALGYFGDK